jgi:hypothetical protein
MDGAYFIFAVGAFTGEPLTVYCSRREDWERNRSIDIALDDDEVERLFRALESAERRLAADGHDVELEMVMEATFQVHPDGCDPDLIRDALEAEPDLGWTRDYQEETVFDVAAQGPPDSPSLDF